MRPCCRRGRHFLQQHASELTVEVCVREPSVTPPEVRLLLRLFGCNYRAHGWWLRPRSFAQGSQPFRVNVVYAYRVHRKMDLTQY